MTISFAAQRHVFRISPILIAAILAFLAGNANSYSEFNQDLADKKQLHYEIASQKNLKFTLKENQSILIKVSQRIADVSLRLISNDGHESKIITTVGSPGVYRQPEHIYIYSKLCRLCELQVIPKNKWDKHHYVLVEITHQNSLDAAAVELHKNYNKALESWYKAEHHPNPSLYLDTLGTTLKMMHQIYQRAMEQNSFYWLWLSSYQVSVIHHYMGNYALQAKKLEELNSLLPSNHYQQPRILLDMASHNIYEMSNFSQASSLIAKALNVADLMDDQLARAELLELQASIFVEEGRFDLATETFNDTISLYLQEGDLFSASNSMISLGWFFFKNGQLQEANRSYRTALVLSERIQDTYSIVNANIKLATVYRLSGDLDKAMKHIKIALLDSSSISHSYLDAWAKQEKAKLLHETGQFSYSVNMYVQAQQAFERLAAMKDARKIDFDLAELHLSIGNYIDAEKHLRSYEYDNSLTEYENGLIQNKIASVYLGQEKYEKALKYQTSSLQNLSISSDVRAIGLSQLNLAIIQSYRSENTKAESLLDQARQNLMKSQDVVNLSAGMYDFAFSIRREQPSRALQIAKQASQLIQKVSTKLKRVDIKRGFISKYQDLNNLIIDLDDHLSTEEALILAESLRATTFNLEAHSRSQKIMPDTLSNISNLNKQLALHINQAKLATNTETREQHFLALRDISERIYDIELLTQKAHQASVPNFSKYSLTELQNSLNFDDLAMFIDVGKSATHIWFIDRKSKSYFKTKSAAFIDQTVADMTRAIETRRSDPFASLPAATALSEALFPDYIFTALKNKKRLIVVPDGSLASIPFSTLPIKDKGNLGDQVSLAYHHSLSLLLHQLQRPTNQNTLNNLLLVAAPTFNVGGNYTHQKSVGFIAPELPFSEIEAKRIAKNSFAKTVSLLKDKATKSAFLDQPLDSFNTIHFATHGITNNYIPELGGLVFSKTDNNENLLLAPEIKRLDLNANLVVLSGCETTVGVQVAGEGLLGLSRAFMQGGAQNVIGSLWKVQDDATAVLMTKFYEYKLNHKMSTSSALAKAKHFVKNYQRKNGKTPWAAPFYWAGFVLYGTGD